METEQEGPVNSCNRQTMQMNNGLVDGKWKMVLGRGQWS